jgi:hypothetical protein
MFDILSQLSFHDLSYRLVVVFLSLYPIWLPILLAYIFMELWISYVRSKFIEKQGSVLLEIKLPAEITRSPAAMEIFFMLLYQKGSPKNLMETYIDGKVRPWFSLELVSTEGQVHFYIWTWPKYKDMIMAQLYAQFPTISVEEAEDYTSWVYHDPENLPMWATYYKLTKEDVIPIKTYIDYGLDRDPKEEFKIDPMTSVLEFLGSMRKGEHIWIQIMIQAHRKVDLKDAHLVKKADWTKAGRAKIKEIVDNATIKPADQKQGSFLNVSKAEGDLIAAIERSLSKYPFEVGIRGFYIAEKQSFDPNRFAGLIGAFQQYSFNDFFNGFKLGKFTDFDWPWYDFQRIRRNKLERSYLDAYKRRSFFHPPYKFYRQNPIILTTEELATIYHLPGQVATTPTMQRITSKRGEPPANLPI